MSNVTVATDQNFQTLVLESHRPVVVDFWAARCGPCRMVAPEVERLAASYSDQVDVVKLDVDANPGISQRFGIMSIPTIALFEDGVLTKQVVGFRPLGELATALCLPGQVAA
jgi:thioredoxin